MMVMLLDLMRFLDALIKLQKATLSFHVCLSVYPSAWNKWVPTERIFIKILNSKIFKSVQKIQVSSKSDKNNGSFT
jgi:hypothetical protein